MRKVDFQVEADIIHRFKRKHFKFNAALTFFYNDSNVVKVNIVGRVISSFP